MAQLKSTIINGNLTVTGDITGGGVSLAAVNNKVKITAWGNNGESNILNSVNGLRAFSVNPNNKPAVGLPSGVSDYGTCIIIGGPIYPILIYISVFGQLAIYGTNQNAWKIISA